MASETIVEALRRNEITEDLTPQQLEKLAAMSRLMRFPEGETIFREGDVGQSVYLIQQGTVAIETHLPGQGRVTVMTLGPGHLLGWSSLFPPQRKTAGGRALTPTRVVALDTAQLWEACRQDHDLGYIIMARVAQIIAERLKVTRLQLLDIFAPA